MTLMKSEAVSNPANVEVWEFHSGADTMSIYIISSHSSFFFKKSGWGVGSILFCIRQCRAFLTSRFVSKRINRKLTGRAS